ncbi:hypothetical protein E2C01_026152 [Portunus trituberculatus]|uniref:Uncharacterized protein n=1 Tax=Portunus trituberculatus TaxID=210409 RepID=A0A5B7EEZ4_PORTR|nr:hypothetical protein [Portunus trituberculatus]
MMYKLINHKEKIDRQDMVSLMEDGDKRTREHSKKIGH